MSELVLIFLENCIVLTLFSANIFGKNVNYDSQCKNLCEEGNFRKMSLVIANCEYNWEWKREMYPRDNKLIKEQTQLKTTNGLNISKKSRTRRRVQVQRKLTPLNSNRNLKIYKTNRGQRLPT